MKQAENRFLAEHWINVLESLDDGLLVLDSAGRIGFMNESAALLTGLSIEKATGHRANEVLRGNRWLDDLLEATGTSGVRNVQVDATLTGRFGRERPVRAAATMMTDAVGTHVGSLITLHDRSYERELESRNREVERLGQLEILLAGLAHEIKNPLSGMRGAAQLLATRNADENRRRECTQIILGEIDRLNGLLTQLLDLTGPARLDKSRVNMHEIVEQVLAIEGAGDERRVQFLRRFDPSLPCVRGDRGRLTQVLLNLVRNAVEVSPPGGQVTVSTRMETSFYVSDSNGREQFLSIDVSDQGPGISQENQSRVFAPFFTTKSEGTGLGLAISQRIVAEHGGVLRLQSEPRHGATFTMTLPVDRSAAHA
ncbi:MAG: nitrogen fixation master sensor histidine kinase [Pseudomonadota bacterium]|jgi:two-component system, NtrC family, nitrogen regulation sensor histidine kinase GlnL